MPVVKLIEHLDLEKNLSSMDRHDLTEEGWNYISLKHLRWSQKRGI